MAQPETVGMERKVIHEVAIGIDRALRQFEEFAQSIKSIKEGKKQLEAAKTKLMTGAAPAPAAAPLADQVRIALRQEAAAPLSDQVRIALQQKADAPLEDQESRTFTMMVSRLPYKYRRGMRRVEMPPALDLETFKSQLKKSLKKGEGEEGSSPEWNLAGDIVVYLEGAEQPVSHLSEIRNKAKILVNPKEIRKVDVPRVNGGFGMNIDNDGGVIKITGDAMKEASVPLHSMIIAVNGEPVNGQHMVNKEVAAVAEGDLVNFTFSLP